jgi:hypothetical protein
MTRVQEHKYHLINWVEKFSRAKLYIIHSFAWISSGKKPKVPITGR